VLRKGRAGWPTRSVASECLFRTAVVRERPVEQLGHTLDAARSGMDAREALLLALSTRRSPGLTAAIGGASLRCHKRCSRPLAGLTRSLVTLGVLAGVACLPGCGEPGR